MSFRILSCSAFCIAPALFSATVKAQAPVEPAGYTLTVHEQIDGPRAVTTTYRRGSKVLVDKTARLGEIEDNSQRAHIRTLFDLETKQSISWDPVDLSVPCERSDFTADDWEDPFAGADALADPEMRHAGKATIHGFATTILESTDDRILAIREWVDPRTGLILKAELFSPEMGKTKPLSEVTDASLTAPPASTFEVPARCSVFAIVPETRKQPGSGSRETGSLGKWTWNAMIGPASKDSCTMLFRVLGLGGKDWNTPITKGIQVAVDLAVSTESAPNYGARLDENGHATFSGGQLHEIAPEGSSGMYRVDSVPKQFVIDIEFGWNGSAAAKVYRQCSEPQTVLQYHSFPEDIQKGGMWEWVKPGLYPKTKP
jgi:hypothetical protein